MGSTKPRVFRILLVHPLKPIETDWNRLKPVLPAVSQCFTYFPAKLDRSPGIRHSTGSWALRHSTCLKFQRRSCRTPKSGRHKMILGELGMFGVSKISQKKSERSEKCVDVASWQVWGLRVWLQQCNTIFFQQMLSQVLRCKKHSAGLRISECRPWIGWYLASLHEPLGHKLRKLHCP